MKKYIWVLIIGLLSFNCNAQSFYIGPSLSYTKSDVGFSYGNDDYGTWSKLKWETESENFGIYGKIEYLTDNYNLDLNCKLNQSFNLQGDSTDYDWRPWSQPGVISDYSHTDESGSETYFDINLNFMVPIYQSFLVGPLIGYNINHYYFEDSNLQGVYDYGTYPIYHDGLVSTYDVIFTSFYIGGRIYYEYNNFSVDTQLKLLLETDANGDAEWLRVGNVFKQEADGSGYQLLCNLGYKLNKNWDIYIQESYINQLYDKNMYMSGIYSGYEFESTDIQNISLQSLETMIFLTRKF